MYKTLVPILLMVVLSGCIEPDASEQERLNLQTAMLKGLCENDSACFDKIDSLAETCHQEYQGDFDGLSEMDKIKAVGGFSACIISQMDQGFQDRFDQAMSVTQTGVEITLPSRDANAKGLLVRLMSDKIRITEKSKQNKDMPLKDLKSYIENQQLADSYALILLFVDDDADTGDMVEAMDVFKNAGIEEIHVTTRK